MSQSNSPRQPDDRYVSAEGENSEAIKRRIEGTREAMDETLDELGNRLNPHSILDDAMEFFKSPQAQATAKKTGGAINAFAQNLGRQIRDNPIPTLLVGAGLAWMAFNSRDDEDELSPSMRKRLRKQGVRPAWDQDAWDSDDWDGDDWDRNNWDEDDWVRADDPTHWSEDEFNDSRPSNRDESIPPSGYRTQPSHAGLVLPEAFAVASDDKGEN